jgi:ribosomal subunit interface protein
MGVRINIPRQRSSAALQQYLADKLGWIHHRFDRQVRIVTVFSQPKWRGISSYRVEVMVRAGGFSIFVSNEHSISYYAAMTGLNHKLQRAIADKKNKQHKMKYR